jgi:hypothetical protein
MTFECPHCAHHISADDSSAGLSGECPSCRQPITFPAPLPQQQAPALPPPLPQNQGDATSGIIPYKNPHALIAYYLGIFGLFPIIGFFLAIPALILGISGLKRCNHNPIIKGNVHAWIGILLGSISIAYNPVLVVLIILASR